MRSLAPRLLALCAAIAASVVCAGCGAGGPAPGRPATTPYAPALHDALPPEVRTAGHLRIATDASYAPASAFAEDGRTIVGFEPDLGAALGRVLGVDVAFENVGFERLVPAVRHDRIDLVMSAMTDTRDRERRVDFVNYFSAGTAVVVQRGNPAGITDLRSLCGRRVAVERGTVQVDLLARSQRNCDGAPVEVRTFDTNADALVRLRTARVDAVLNDYPPAALLAGDPRTRASYQLASTAQYEPGLYGIAVAKDRPALTAAVRGALDELIRSGEYRRILRRWGVADGAVTATSVNAGSA